MWTRVSRILNPRGLALLGVLVVFIAVGCGGNISPFLSAQFAQTFLNLPDRNQGTPTTPPDDSGNVTTITSVCQLETVNRSIQIALQNQAQQFVNFAITFVASAGGDGFVCDTEIADYLNAGYVDGVAPGQTVLPIGCDPVPLTAGSRMLVMRFGINQLGNVRLNPGTAEVPSTLTLVRRDTNSPLIPLPELIVFGDADANFVCTGNNLCTQRGFVYVSGANIPIGKSVEAARLQGTLCAEGVGSAPEWRLDKTITDAAQAHQYAAGGTIIGIVLDRALDSLANGRNQVVWRVTDANNDVIHFEDPG